MHVELEETTEMDGGSRLHEPLANLRAGSLGEAKPPAVDHLAGSASRLVSAAVEALIGRR
jgi:hypothetical protein